MIMIYFNIWSVGLPYPLSYFKLLLNQNNITLSIQNSKIHWVFTFQNQQWLCVYKCWYIIKVSLNSQPTHHQRLLLVPYGELKHSGRTISWAPPPAASLISCTARATFLVFISPTAIWMRAMRKAAKEEISSLSYVSCLCWWYPSCNHSVSHEQYKG